MALPLVSRTSGLIDTAHGRQSVEHPFIADAFARMPGGLRDLSLRPTSVQDAATALRRAIERRSKQMVVPGTQRLAVALPGLAQAMVDRILRS